MDDDYLRILLLKHIADRLGSIDLFNRFINEFREFPTENIVEILVENEDVRVFLRDLFGIMLRIQPRSLFSRRLKPPPGLDNDSLASFFGNEIADKIFPQETKEFLETSSISRRPPKRQLHRKDHEAKRVCREQIDELFNETPEAMIIDEEVELPKTPPPPSVSPPAPSSQEGKMDFDDLVEKVQDFLNEPEILALEISELFRHAYISGDSTYRKMLMIWCQYLLDIRITNSHDSPVVERLTNSIREIILIYSTLSFDAQTNVIALLERLPDFPIIYFLMLEAMTHIAE